MDCREVLGVRQVNDPVILVNDRVEGGWTTGEISHAGLGFRQVGRVWSRPADFFYKESQIRAYWISLANKVNPAFW